LVLGKLPPFSLPLATTLHEAIIYQRLHRHVCHQYIRARLKHMDPLLVESHIFDINLVLKDSGILARKCQVRFEVTIVERINRSIAKNFPLVNVDYSV